MADLRSFGQGVSRGFWADGMGGPVDMVTLLANLGIAGGGYAGHKLGLLSKPPELIENPVGGSEWIAQKMRQGGLLADNPGSTADNYGRVVGGLLGPVTQARAPQIANALQQAPAAIAAAASPKYVAMGGGVTGKQGGAVNFEGPQSKALRIAQANAAKPIAQGGLGLHQNNTPAERAQAMGYTVEAYHGTRTPENIYEFVPGGVAGSVRSGDAYGTGVYTSTAPSTASSGAYTGDTGAVLPLLINRGGHLNVDAPTPGDFEKLSKFASANLLPSDKARLAGRTERLFKPSEIDDAKDFFRNQQANAKAFGDGYARNDPIIDKTDGGDFIIRYVDFDAPVKAIQTADDMNSLRRAVGWDFIPDLGYSGHTMNRSAGEAWDITADTSKLRSRFAAFDPLKRNSSNILAGLGAGGLGVASLLDERKGR